MGGARPGLAASAGTARWVPAWAAGLRVTASPPRWRARMATELGNPAGHHGAALDLANRGADAVDPQGLVVQAPAGHSESVVADAPPGSWCWSTPDYRAQPRRWGVLPPAEGAVATARVMSELADFTPACVPTPATTAWLIVDLNQRRRRLARGRRSGPRPRRRARPRSVPGAARPCDRGRADGTATPPGDRRTPRPCRPHRPSRWPHAGILSVASAGGAPACP